VADLQINYDRLHELAGDARTLKSHLDDTVPSLSLGTMGDHLYGEHVGNAALSSSLFTFSSNWEKPFQDSMDRLGDLATLLDSVATKFFDMDSDFAAKAGSALSQQKMSAWEAKEEQYNQYLENKDKMFQPHALYNADGVLEEQPAVHLYNYGDGEGQIPIPADPGERPDTTSYDTGSSGNSGETDTAYDDDGRVTSETSTITSSTGLTYTETTTHTYDGDSEDPSTTTTTIEHSDGTVDTIVTTYHDDGSYTIDSEYEDPDDEDNNTSSTTEVTPTVGEDGSDLGYTAVSVDQDGETTTTVVTNEDAVGPTILVEDEDGSVEAWPTDVTGEDTKVVTDDDGTVRTYTGDYEYDSWTQVSGPDENEDSDDDTSTGSSTSSTPAK